MKIEDLIEARNKILKSVREYEKCGGLNNITDEIITIFDSLIIKESTKSNLSFPSGIRSV